MEIGMMIRIRGNSIKKDKWKNRKEVLFFSFFFFLFCCCIFGFKFGVRNTNYVGPEFN